MPNPSSRKTGAKSTLLSSSYDLGTDSLNYYTSTLSGNHASLSAHSVASLSASSLVGDTLVASGANDTLISHAGRDSLVALGTGAVLVAGSGNDTLVASVNGALFQVGTLSATDYFIGNGVSPADTLSLINAGSYKDTQFAHASGIQILSLTGASALTLGSALKAAGVSSVFGGSGGSDTFVQAAVAGNSMPVALIGSGGNNLYTIANRVLLAQDTITGSGATDTLALGYSPTGYNDTSFAHTTNLGVLSLGGAGVTLGSNFANSGLKQVRGTSAITQNAPVSGLTLIGGATNDTITVSNASLLSGDSIVGGGGSDMISISVAGAIADSFFTHVSGVKTLSLTSASSLEMGTALATAGILSVMGGSGGDSFIQDATDTNHLTLKAGAANSGSGDLFSIANSTLAGNDFLLGSSAVDTLFIGTAGNVSDSVFANTHYMDVLSLSGGSAVTLGANVLGAGIRTVYGGNGSDTITQLGTQWKPSTLVGGSGNDLFSIANAVIGTDSIVGGGGLDTLALTTSTKGISDGTFKQVTGIGTLSLAGASTVQLGILAAAAGITSVFGGSRETLTQLAGDTLGLTISDGGSDKISVGSLAQLPGDNFLTTGSADTVSAGVKTVVTGTRYVFSTASTSNHSTLIGVTGDTLSVTGASHGKYDQIITSAGVTVQFSDANSGQNDTVTSGMSSRLNFSGNFSGQNDTIKSGKNSSLSFSGTYSGNYDSIIAGANSSLSFSGYRSGFNRDSITAGENSSLSFSGTYSGNYSDSIIAGANSSLSFSGIEAGCYGDSITAGENSSLSFSGIVAGCYGDSITTGANSSLNFAGSNSGQNDIISLGNNDQLSITYSSLLAADTISGGTMDTLVITNADTINDSVFANDSFSGGAALSLSGSSSAYLGSLAAEAGITSVFGGDNDTITQGAGDTLASYIHAGSGNLLSVPSFTTPPAPINENLTFSGSGALSSQGGLSFGNANLSSYSYYYTFGRGFSRHTVSSYQNYVQNANGTSWTLSSSNMNPFTLESGSFAQRSPSDYFTATAYDAQGVEIGSPVTLTGSGYYAGSGSDVGGYTFQNQTFNFDGVSSVVFSDIAGTTDPILFQNLVVDTLGTSVAPLANDTIVGSGSDTLNFLGASTLDDSAFATVSLGSGSGYLSLAGTSSVYLGSLAAASGIQAIIAGANDTITQGALNTNSLYINTGNYNDFLSFANAAQYASDTFSQGLTGIDTIAIAGSTPFMIQNGVTLGGGTSTILGNNQSFTVAYASLLAADTISGGTNDTLIISNAGTVNDSVFANDSFSGGVALSLSGGSSAYLGSLAVEAGITSVFGGDNDTITQGAGDTLASYIHAGSGNLLSVPSFTTPPAPINENLTFSGSGALSSQGGLSFGNANLSSYSYYYTFGRGFSRHTVSSYQNYVQNANGTSWTLSSSNMNPFTLESGSFAQLSNSDYFTATAYDALGGEIGSPVTLTGSGYSSGGGPDVGGYTFQNQTFNFDGVSSVVFSDIAGTTDPILFQNLVVDTLGTTVAPLANDTIVGSGSDTLNVLGASTLNDSAFATVSLGSASALSLNGSSSVILGLDASHAGISSIFGGAGSVSIYQNDYDSGSLYLDGSADSLGSTGNLFDFQYASLAANDTIVGSSLSGTAGDTLRIESSGPIGDTLFSGNGTGSLSGVAALQITQSYQWVTLGSGAAAEGIHAIYGVYQDNFIITAGNTLGAFTTDTFVGTGLDYITVDVPISLGDAAFTNIRRFNKLSLAGDSSVTLGGEALLSGFNNFYGGEGGDTFIQTSLCNHNFHFHGLADSLGSAGNLFVIQNTSEAAADTFEGSGLTGSIGDTLAISEAGSLSDMPSSSGVAALSLSGASEVTLGINAQNDNLASLYGGSGDTTITQDSSDTLPTAIITGGGNDLITINRTVNENLTFSGSGALSSQGGLSFGNASTGTYSFSYSGDSGGYDVQQNYVENADSTQPWTLSSAGSPFTLESGNFSSYASGDSFTASAYNAQGQLVDQVTLSSSGYYGSSSNFGPDGYNFQNETFNFDGVSSVVFSDINGTTNPLIFQNLVVDTVLGGPALNQDSISGSGADTLAILNADTINDSVFANVSLGSASVLSLTGSSAVTLGANAQFAGITKVIGGNGASTLNASSDSTSLQLIGGSASDSLIAGSGTDTLQGWCGTSTTNSVNDTLTAGSGSDLFILGDATGNAYNGTTAEVSINGFKQGTDILQLHNYGSGASNYSLSSLPGGIEDISYNSHVIAQITVVSGTQGNILGNAHFL